MLTDTVGGTMDFAVEREESGDRMFGDRVGRVTGILELGAAAESTF